MKRQKRCYDKRKHATSESYSVGDAVWVYHPATTGSRKLHQPWRGPYKIIEILEPCNYRIRFWGQS